jgi:hypothetical protein
MEEQLDLDNYQDNIVTISLSKDQIIPSNWKKIDIVVRYLDTNNVLQTYYVFAAGGSFYFTKNFNKSPTSALFGLTDALCQFATYNDKLFITTGSLLLFK